MSKQTSPDDTFSVSEAQTQKVKMLQYLQEHGSIDRLTALRKLGIVHPPTRINHLRREGHNITTVYRKSKNNKRYGVYIYTPPKIITNA